MSRARALLTCRHYQPISHDRPISWLRSSPLRRLSISHIHTTGFLRHGFHQSLSWTSTMHLHSHFRTVGTHHSKKSPDSSWPVRQTFQAQLTYCRGPIDDHPVNFKSDSHLIESTRCLTVVHTHRNGLLFTQSAMTKPSWAARIQVESCIIESQPCLTVAYTSSNGLLFTQSASIIASSAAHIQVDSYLLESQHCITVAHTPSNDLLFTQSASIKSQGLLRPWALHKTNGSHHTL